MYSSHYKIQAEPTSKLSNSLVFEVFWLFFGKLVKVVGFHIKATAPANDKEKQEQESGKKYSPLKKEPGQLSIAMTKMEELIQNFWLKIRS